MRLFVIVHGAGGRPSWRSRRAGRKRQPTTGTRSSRWLVGSNYIPATAINQLEMWQAGDIRPGVDGDGTGLGGIAGDDDDARVPARSAVETGSRERSSGGSTNFWRCASRHKIKPIFVLFDSCWDPFPRMGTQHDPKPGVHNSGWVQSPGSPGLKDPQQYDRLRLYIQGVIGAYRYDRRVLAWDLWNEPDNMNDGSYGKIEPTNKKELVLALLPKVFAWARAMEPLQPVTSGVWKGDWSSPEKLSAFEKIQLEQSDVISFHNYGGPEDFEKRVKWLEAYKRPILCTEYMARPMGSTFQAILPMAKKYNVAAINWGFVDGKTQTRLPWDSWKTPYVDHEPPVWFHDIFHKDGTPYKQEEVDFIIQMTGKGVKTKKVKSGK